MQPLITWGILALIVIESCANAQRPLFSKAPGSSSMSGRQPDHIVTADVNSDGHLDVLTANNGSNDLSVLLGDGYGKFSPLPGSPFPTAKGDPSAELKPPWPFPSKTETLPAV